MAKSKPAKAALPTKPFAAAEPLHRRCIAEHVAGNVLLPPGVDVPESSVNRGGAGFGPAEDVLEGDDSLGIATFRYDDMPGPFMFDGIRYDVAVAHTPKPANLAHSDIRVSKNGDFNKYRVLPPEHHVKLQYAISEKARITRAPK